MSRRSGLVLLGALLACSGSTSLALFQLTFADLDLSSPTWPPAVLPFAHIGVVDSAFGAKPALAAWDSILARRRLP